MNMDQAQGSAKYYAGRVQEEVGSWFGSSEQQVKGLRKQVTGKAEWRIGDIRALIKEAEALARINRRPGGTLADKASVTRAWR